jgi:colanic acid/amylovoran biosynthesis glycosyltransferase
VAVSSYTRSQLYRWVEHQYWSKVQVVHCGLEGAYFATPVIPVPVARRLVCVGRLCEQKGQLVLVEAARRLIVQGVDFELVLAGDGEMRAAIEAFVKSHDLWNRVCVTGWIASERVREEILAARALVLPSFAEGLPVVIMEAMALRRPVISTFVGGIPELVQTGEHGWLVSAGDMQALMHAMQTCLNAPTVLLDRMGQAAYERANSFHRVDKETARLATLFRRSRGGPSAQTNSKLEQAGAFGQSDIGLMTQPDAAFAASGRDYPDYADYVTRSLVPSA